MALSMPLNGLKEEDKEPLIELFVKVRSRPPSRPAESPAAAGPSGALSGGAPQASHRAPTKGGEERGASGHCLGATAPSRLSGQGEGSGAPGRRRASAERGLGRTPGAAPVG